MAKRNKSTVSAANANNHSQRHLDPVEEALGTTLRQLRQARGMNQTELGRRLGVSLQQVQKYESGTNRMAASTLFRAAEILGVEISALFDGAKSIAPHSKSVRRIQKRSVLIIPFLSKERSKAPREAELIEVAMNYQAIEIVSERTLARKLLKRLAAPSGRTGTASR